MSKSLNKGVEMDVHFDVDGNKLYSLNPYNGKYLRMLLPFFNKQNDVYHKALQQIVGEKLMVFSNIEPVQKLIFEHNRKIFGKFLFGENYHNFLCFLMQFKHELENINIFSCVEYRSTFAKNFNTIEIDENGILVKDETKHVCTNTNRGRRLTDTSRERKFEWFEKCLVNDKASIDDETMVVRMADGSGPIMFFNIIKGFFNKTEEEKNIKNYEIDRLRCVYSQINKLKFDKVNACRFKHWKNWPIERQIGSKIKKLEPSYKQKMILEISKYI